MPRLDAVSLDRLYRRAGAERWTVDRESFAEALERSQLKLGAVEPSALVERLGALHLEDLALACALAVGHEAAWEHFVLEYRPALYRAAAAIDPGGNPRELADSLYAELYGLKERDGERASLFRYFHGLSSLATWLRAILAQRHVDRVRVERRFDPMPDEDPPPDAAPREASLADPGRGSRAAKVEAALSAAVAALAPKDRLRLAWYYAREMTLAQIGRVLKEHEATVSRHLARTRKALREEVERRLAADCGLSAREIDEAFAEVADDPGAMDLRSLIPDEPGRKNPGVRRSTSEGMP